jgi:hypothetical protein
MTVPTAFLAACNLAKRRAVGWHVPGGMLFEIAAREQPAAELVTFTRENLMQWLLDHYANCMSRVPSDRRQEFLRGVCEAAGDRLTRNS